MSALSPQQASIIRNLGLRGGLMDCYKLFWPLIETSEFKANWHHEQLCEYLEDVQRSEKGRDIIFNVPPGSGKSSLVNVVYPIYCWLKRPTTRIIVGSFDAQLALRDARRHAQVMQHEIWQQCFQDICSLPNTFADSEINNQQGGWRYSTSIPGGRVTGRHADIHIYDDPVKPAEVTKLALQKAKIWMGETAASRFQDISARKRILIMQRLHEDDPSGFLEEQGFEVVRLPMRYEKAYSHPKDPRKEEGELLWPAFKTEEAVKALEHDQGPMGTASQLQQRPAPEGGAIFRRDWLKFWYPIDDMPAGPYTYCPDQERKERPRKFSRIIQSWDMAFLDMEKSDWVVGQVWGIFEGSLYLQDQVRGRWDAPKTAREVQRLSEKWPRARLKLIEKKANGPAVMQMLKKRLTGMVAVEPDGGKIARANAAAPLFESGYVYIPDPTRCTWTMSYLYELFLFPNGKFDDQVDATSQALNYLDKKKLLGQSLAKTILEDGWRV